MKKESEILNLIQNTIDQLNFECHLNSVNIFFVNHLWLQLSNLITDLPSNPYIQFKLLIQEDHLSYVYHSKSLRFKDMKSISDYVPLLGSSNVPQVK